MTLSLGGYFGRGDYPVLVVKGKCWDHALALYSSPPAICFKNIDTVKHYTIKGSIDISKSYSSMRPGKLPECIECLSSLLEEVFDNNYKVIIETIK